MNSPATFGTADADQRRWHLPADVSGFVGRGGELARLAHLLGRARLVTVAGPGGVGKTRLALRAASAASQADSSRASCLIELSALTSPELLMDTVAARLNVQPPDTASLLDAVIDELRHRRLLLILDTCEHLPAACAHFAATVLRETTDVSILATSRQPLHVTGEQLLRLQPLPVPSSDAVAAADAGAAVELFTQRAAAAVSGFTLSEADLPHVIRLCRRLDGIPLAIELAAVRVRALPITELATRVDQGLTTSMGSRRGSTGRHQTLHAAIDWSYQLCTDAEKAAWRRLSVFAGTFDAAVAADVIALACPAGHAGSRGTGSPDDASHGAVATAAQVDEVLRGLADKSVLLAARTGRYRLLDTVREYGATRLAETGEEAACRERYMAKYLSLSSDFSRRVVTDGQRDRLLRLRAEHENIRGALAYGFAAPEPGGDRDAEATPTRMRSAARLAAALFSYWVMSGATREGIGWQDKALEWFTGPSSERANALSNLALLATAAGAANAVGQAIEAVAVSARVGDERANARAYLALQFALTTAGRHLEALEAAKQARWRLEKVGADHALRTLDMQLGLTYVHARNFDAAVEHCRRLLRSLAPGERWLRGNTHALCALAFYHQPGRRADCVTMVRMALRETHEIGNLVGEAYSLELLAWLAADGGRYQRAALLLGGAQSLWERNGGRLSGSAALEQHHKRSAATAAGSLGTARYTELHAAGATRALTEITALALTNADVLPDQSGALSQPDPGDDWHGSEVLTAREREIAVLVGSGLSNREIAARLVISKRTVDAHVNHIFSKLGLTSRVQLAIWLRDRAADALSPTAQAL
jgi:predicted ATPase/DNA-binding CsgD family transcriptional regulator